jgi:hypothetical protein
LDVIEKGSISPFVADALGEAIAEAIADFFLLTGVV